MAILINAFHWSFFHHNLKNAWSKLPKKILIMNLHAVNTKKGHLSLLGHAVAQLVETLRYKPEVRGSDSRWCHLNS
jgi:hypothetical protein